MKRLVRTLLMVGWWVATPLASTAQQPGSFAGQDDSTAPANPYMATGRVVTEGGIAAPGVMVLLEISDMRIRRPIASDQQRTDSRGEFSFDLSAHDIPTLGLEFTVDSPRYQPRIKIIEVAQDALPAQVELTVEPGTLARGTVTNTEGKPLEGVRVVFSGGRPRQSDENGEWEAWGLPTGRAVLQLRAPGYAPANVEVTSEEPTIVEGIEVILESARQLSGRVVTRAGMGIDGAYVGLATLDTNQRLAPVRTRDGGKFTFTSVPDAQHDFRLTAEAPPPFLTTVEEVNVAPDSSTALELVLDEGLFLAGRLTTQAGTAVGGARVLVLDMQGSQLGEAVADADGRWRVGAFEPGEALRVVALPGVAEANWGIADLVIELPKAGATTMTGFVELWNRPFSSTFEATMKDGRLSMTRTDTGRGGLGARVVYDAAWDGEAEKIEGTLEVPEQGRTGTFTMTRRYKAVGAEGPTALAGEWEIREEVGAARLLPSPTMWSVTLPVLPVDVRTDHSVAEAGRIAGRVAFADGSPFVDGQVMLGGWNRTNVLMLRAPIKPDGTFELAGVPADGTFRLMAQDAAGEAQTREQIARAGLTNLLLTDGERPADGIDE